MKRGAVSVGCLAWLLSTFSSRCSQEVFALASSKNGSRKTSFVTGANGYIGRALVHQLLQERDDDDDDDDDHDIVCLVRPQRVATETEFWNKHDPEATTTVRVMPYDMLDRGETLEQALETAGDGEKCVYHVASVFGPTDDHRQTALDNVQGTEDLVRTLAKNNGGNNNCKLVLTSSMAAVRGSGQDPLNGEYYTYKDWNTLSELGANWGASYQWSKAESERCAWQLCKELDVPMVSLCPSFVFGPPFGMSGSYALTLVGQWARGESPVQSRLYVDVRDVARAHVAAGMRPQAIGKRYIVSTEARIPSQEIASWLKDVCQKNKLSNSEKIYHDANFKGGAIQIGDKEVDATERLEHELGITLQPVKDTIMDMAQVLLQEETSKI